MGSSSVKDWPLELVASGVQAACAPRRISSFQTERTSIDKGAGACQPHMPVCVSLPVSPRGSDHQNSVFHISKVLLKWGNSFWKCTPCIELNVTAIFVKTEILPNDYLNVTSVNTAHARN